VEKTEYVFMSRDQDAEQNHNMKIGNNTSEGAETFTYTYLGTTKKNQNYIHDEIESRLNS
jgi:hypothetical protein